MEGGSDDAFTKLIKVIQSDPGRRGIHNTFVASGTELKLFAEALLDSDHVVITTGFYIVVAGAPETDGPLGTIALCQALASLGKTITVLTDNFNVDLLRKCVEWASMASLVTVTTLPVLPDNCAPDVITPAEKAMAQHFLESLAASAEKPLRLVLVALERVGRTSVGFDRGIAHTRALLSLPLCSTWRSLSTALVAPTTTCEASRSARTVVAPPSMPSSAMRTGCGKTHPAPTARLAAASTSAIPVSAGALPTFRRAASVMAATRSAWSNFRPYLPSMGQRHNVPCKCNEGLLTSSDVSLRLGAGLLPFRD